ncbi:phosphoribomutase PRM15 KNAG_0J00270 [Huiozyma naganishii CBS 8797]|uniref:phosphopentomutase n=1 Tax=Huiozyma naganishii (strain ATCC MYA-139 / BCRC 22969 / CBS 8797 / KCTC 17520 / NBRC 10181 / NCYC 3082 / Yp74L-3) TaxID=1071383 RepID=J7RB55_HUIN7|nr:hypothetical protein KNAG_0J00270 [Kazachstania naganishii CBS 8797]CCK72110.1 hypothetical protein KNAG_0J00270 [Kazachstania naganishii CBS 8797]
MDKGTLHILQNAPEGLQHRILEWLRLDKNEETRREVLDLCQRQDWSELNSRFSQRILFGTAGLRSRMEAGTNRLNSLVILQATQGLARYIASQFPKNKVAVVGHDHRFHSKEFATVTAAVFLRAGFKVLYLNPGDTLVHTPLVPFTVDHLNASVGVMITASHNPKMDNGYKVYFANGCQIIPPHDLNIARSIDQNLEPWEPSWDWPTVIQAAEKEDRIVYVKDQMTQLYTKTAELQLIGGRKVLRNPGSGPWFVYTPMHGVGSEIFSRISEDVLGIKENEDYLCVPEQKHPDPSFPTVSFPNPEEKGALDKAIELASQNGINLVIANDPDADRFSLAVFDSKTANWRQLTGNEIGFLFAYQQFEMYKAMDDIFQKEHPLVLLNSTVSSQMIKKMAEVEGFHYEDTLTGFKWIGNRARDLEKKGFFAPFGYEEAIGYMFTQMEHDKDGISASLMFLLSYYHWVYDAHKFPLDILEDGYKKYGVFKEYNGYYIVDNPKIMKETFDYIRNDRKPGTQYPEAIGSEFQVVSFRDLTLGFQSDTSDHIPTLPVDPNSQMITVCAKPTHDNVERDHVRFTIRGSGTEPKLKVYIEACSGSETGAQQLAKQMWDTLQEVWFRPQTTGLVTDF